MTSGTQTVRSVLKLIATMSRLQNTCSGKERWNLWEKQRSRTTRLTPQEEITEICGCRILTVHFRLIRQDRGRQPDAAAPPDMKYGGNICCLLLVYPDSLMIHRWQTNKGCKLLHPATQKVLFNNSWAPLRTSLSVFDMIFASASQSFLRNERNFKRSSPASWCRLSVLIHGSPAVCHENVMAPPEQCQA